MNTKHLGETHDYQQIASRIDSAEPTPATMGSVEPSLRPTPGELGQSPSWFSNMLSVAGFTLKTKDMHAPDSGTKKPVCPVCDSRGLLLRRGPFGDVFFCRNYPECRGLKYALKASGSEIEGEYVPVWAKGYDSRLLDALAAAISIHARTGSPLSKHRWSADENNKLDQKKLAAAELSEDRAWRLQRKARRAYRADLDGSLRRAEDECELAERQYEIAPAGIQTQVAEKIWRATQRKLRKVQRDHRRCLNYLRDDFDPDYNHGPDYDPEQEWLDFHLSNQPEEDATPESLVDDPIDVLSPHPMGVFLQRNPKQD